jgi:pimeloyl-ACP methyl ester carboxylesterase
MQKELQFITVDNYTIYGTLDSASSDTLIIFIHGLTGNQYEHHYFNAVPFFNNHDYDTFRFDLYSKRKNARQL